ncbi:MAG: hypothetical protein COX62_00080 [Deltaproteobacteria bacterium CG_4_10_14_0_2_um_filter_43_8]|nr:MAG: hypothetical protein COV43_09525 [Deltaproteobacteria bacterium CG11_big_fil_rev_8_21_14_0_20_42_23]PJA22371.1 MAG: hypothetical protein COX62_00080 [Deltaproteobacteria bacterium CG_4_10_14_0_2_um_filter_43_8]PJC64342.1 MAG: hypothetical protein CO021_04880 [Deltaproteobacteria bacterium CG_4_9_14_0_2_um_filter_42_21]
MTKRLITTCAVLLLAACSQAPDQFTAWQDEVFPKTQITLESTRSITIANPSKDEEQHLRFAGFEPYSNAEGHFQVTQVLVGGQESQQKDIVIPPGDVLKVKVTYSPLNLETTKASFGGWVTGETERWTPVTEDQVGEYQQSQVKEYSALHRGLLQFMFDSPREGLVYVQLIGEAAPGPNGELAIGATLGECTPGDQRACYSGGFALDIPSLLPGGPTDLIITGKIPITISDEGATLSMDEFPPVIMYLRSTEIPDLPSGVTATMIITGSKKIVAEGSFDGTRLDLDGVSFRIRVVLGELDPEQVTPGLAGIVDFDIPNLMLETLEPLSGGNITLRLETTLPAAPSGNDLFDQFLGNAKIIAFMKGQLEF